MSASNSSSFGTHVAAEASPLGMAIVAMAVLDKTYGKQTTKSLDGDFGGMFRMFQFQTLWNEPPGCNVAHIELIYADPVLSVLVHAVSVFVID